MRRTRKILVVDDEPQLLKTYRTLLSEHDFQVVTAGTGREAMAALERESFDLLLLDLNMPEVNGHAVMEFINTRKLNVATVVISGEVSFDWVSKAFLLGAYDYLKKPVELEALLNTLRNALRKRELEENLLRLQRQLARSERLHRFMIENSPDIIFIVDLEGRFAFVNDRAKDLLGYGKDELVGRHFAEIVAPESLEKAEYCFMERRAGERATRDAEIWLMCKSGSERREPGHERIAIELNAAGVYENEEEVYADEESLKSFSGTYVVARDITERLASEKLIHYQAYHDLLTGLPNRALFLDRLHLAISNARRAQDCLTVMFLDLDRFKMVNDTMGHSAGDKLLVSVARRLKSCLRESDTLARIGGDEFTVLLPNVETEEVARTVAEKIVRTIKEPFELEGQEIFVTTSIGIAMFPRDGETADVLIKNSDIAMYHTKGQSKNGFHLFDNDMSVRQHKLLSIENDIRRGLKEGQFEVYFQPQVDLSEGRIVGVEALMRWNHPEKGLLAPAFFLAVAEESGLMVELGEWALDSALAVVQSWAANGVRVDKLAVNFSAREIEQKDFVDRIITALQRHAFPPSRLEIEITEGTLMRDVEDIIGKLQRLHDRGVKVAIDDFGTGYSSLSLLHRLPIDRLKIDRSFIRGMTEGSERSIIEAIAHMAKGLKLEMVAEGVEEEYQLRYLRELACPVVQGFLFSRGVPAGEALALLLRCREGSEMKKHLA